MNARGVLVVSLSVLLAACREAPDASVGSGAAPATGAPQPAFTPEQVVERAASEGRGLRVAWFGHSLMETSGPDGINVPVTVDAIAETARAVSRTSLPAGLTRSFYDGPHDLRYWWGPGKGPERLRAEGDDWDYVVGVGFMHLVGPGRRHPTIFGLASRFSERFKTYEAYTPSKYQWIKHVRDAYPRATWLNYVGPRFSTHRHEQGYVDERFECIRETALASGGRVDNVPVGRAFCSAEEAARARPELTIRLQVEDRLHLTRQGEFLVANVFFARMYGVDPTGLPVPAHLQGKLGEGSDEAAVATFLQRVAADTVAQWRRGERPACGEGARLPEDDRGAELLRAK